MNTEPFHIFLVDDASEVFAAHGPLTDDRSWRDRILTAQNAGRHVRCFTTQGLETMQSEISRFASESGYKWVNSIKI